MNAAWGDEAFSKDAWAVGRVEEVGPDASGVRSVIEYRRNPTTGAKEKVTRRFKREVRVLRVPKVVEERVAWRRFGKALSEGNDGTCARSYDDLHFEVPGVAAKDELDKLKDTKASVVVCRKCGAVGDHYTLKCPYKDIASAALAAAGMGAGDGAPTLGAGMMGGDGDGFGGMGGMSGEGGRYVPPSKRAGGGPGGGAPGVPELETNVLRVSNLGEDVTEDQIRDLFARYGRVERCYLARDKETNESKGFAFVTFALGSEAERARQAVNGYPLDHLILRVEYARPSNKDGGGGGGPGGGGLASSGFVSGYGKALPQSRP